MDVTMNKKMVDMICLLLSAALTLPSAARGDGNLIGQAIIDHTVISEIVDRHNEFRRVPDSSDMKLMSWDPELAYHAQEYSKRCRFIHTTKAERAIDSYGQNVGENLLNTGAYSEYELFYYGIKDWRNENSYYNYTDGSCSAKFCGHYTQIVWADSYKVGCGASECSSVEDGVGGWMLVCLYHPAGNVVLYDVPQKPYNNTGAFCSNCDSGDNCTANLCTNSVRDAVIEWVLPTTTQPSTADLTSTTDTDLTTAEPSDTTIVTTENVVMTSSMTTIPSGNVSSTSESTIMTSTSSATSGNVSSTSESTIMTSTSSATREVRTSMQILITILIINIIIIIICYRYRYYRFILLSLVCNIVIKISGIRTTISRTTNLGGELPSVVLPRDIDPRTSTTGPLPPEQQLVVLI